MWTDHQHQGADQYRAGQPAEISSTASDIASRLAYHFDLQGPVTAVDSSCASGLTALHLAARSIELNECDSAVVAGVNLFSHPYHLQLLRHHGLLADPLPTGIFDPDRPGWIPGEACVAGLLRSISATESHQDVPLAWIESSAIGHTGANPGRFSVPDSKAVERVLRNALGSISPAEIGYIEAACSGARLADLAEQDALWRIFPQSTRWGTIKTTAGHSEAASGLVQLIKVLHIRCHSQHRWSRHNATRLALRQHPPGATRLDRSHRIARRDRANTRIPKRGAPTWQRCRAVIEPRRHQSTRSRRR